MHKEDTSGHKDSMNLEFRSSDGGVNVEYNCDGFVDISIIFAMPFDLCLNWRYQTGYI